MHEQMIGQMAIAIAFSGINELGRTVSPVFLLMDHFLYFSFKEHINIMLKKVYSKIGALRRLNKRLVPAYTMSLLYKSFALSHFEYWNSLLMGIGKTVNKKLEDANFYGLRTIMNMGKNTDCESILRMVDMNTLEHRRIEQSLIIVFKCFKENGPGYVANLFKPRVTTYIPRSSGLNLVQTSCNSRILHGSYAYMISRIWNQLPSAVKMHLMHHPFGDF